MVGGDTCKYLRRVSSAQKICVIYLQLHTAIEPLQIFTRAERTPRNTTAMLSRSECRIPQAQPSNAGVSRCVIEIPHCRDIEFAEALYLCLPQFPKEDRDVWVDKCAREIDRLRGLLQQDNPSRRNAKSCARYKTATTFAQFSSWWSNKFNN